MGKFWATSNNPTNGQTIIADSTVPSGARWADPSVNVSYLDARYDARYVDLTSDQNSIGGNKTFTGAIGQIGVTPVHSLMASGTLSLATAGLKTYFTTSSFGNNAGVMLNVSVVGGTASATKFSIDQYNYNGGYVGNLMAIDINNKATSFNTTLYPANHNTQPLGLSTNYWQNIYGSTLNLNATASITGSTAGALIVTGDLRVTTAGTNAASVVTTAGTQSLSNKNLSTGNTFPTFNQNTTGNAGSTNALKSATTVVDVSASTAPAAGQVLTAVDGATATWQNVPSGFANPMTTAGDIIYENSTPTPARLPAGSATQILHSGATPSWSAVSLTADVSGTLPITNGGTGSTSHTTYGIAYFDGTSIVTSAAMTYNAATPLTRFNNGRIAIRDNSLEENVTNAGASLVFNYLGYNAGNSQFRDWQLYNGKAATIMTATGSNRQVAFFGGKTVFTAPTTGNSSVNFPTGTAPTSPVDGDMWYNGTSLFFKIGTTNTAPIAATLPSTSKTANYTALSTDCVIYVDTTAGAVTITTPQLANHVFYIKKISADANAMNITPSSGTIDGASTFQTLAISKPSYSVHSDGTNSYLI